MSTLAAEPSQDFETLRVYIEEQCAIDVPKADSHLFESRLKQLLVENQCDTYSEFCQMAKADQTGSIRERIIDAITTNDTFWFRDEHTWTVMREVIIPRFAKDLAEGKKDKIRIWSTACSTGEETYSLAILIDQFIKSHSSMGLKPEQFDILGTDISPSALFIAISARFNKISMARGVPEDVKASYFTESANISILNEDIKKRVKYKKFNLQDSFAELGTFDLILCRNVAIYFSAEFKQDLFTRMAQVMNPEGFFMLGSCENLVGSQTAFEMKDHESITYYTKQG